MKQWKRWMCALLVAALLIAPMTALAEADTAQAQLTLEDLQAMVGDAALVHTDDAGNLVFLEGSCASEPIQSLDDAAALLDTLTPLLGGDERTQFEPWRTLTDASGNQYYVFQQMYADTTVSGGAAKVVTDADGNMLGLVCSVQGELPDGAQEGEGITPKQAEALAIQSMLDTYGAQAELIEGRTEKIILPVIRGIDLEAEKTESRFVWAVYTNNPSGSVSDSSDLPYLAHYITLDGEYLYNLPTILPGDEVSTTGYDAAYTFEFMEPVEYTGMATLSDGTEREITVDLMRDSRTGMYYLGNIERRIAVADCYEFLYNDGHVVLEASRDNADWDNTCLLALYNYCRAWDYYHAIGWTGGDGLGTPMLILKDFCNSQHESINNACYAGKYFGWQTFLSSASNDYYQCLDVLAHEFTHCVTRSVMTYNAYMNDYGAINEAISDIQGNLCEMLMGATEDTTWAMGENSTVRVVRSMSDPHQFGQPEYTWDFSYKPNVKVPTTFNDRGGVHTNSSLLNNTAYRLCVEGGMPLEDARAFWFAADCSMVPGSDYAQLSLLMPWVLRNNGLEQYGDALEAAMDATGIRSNDVPDKFDDDRALVTLTLPDDERFQDGNWAMSLFTLDTEAFTERINAILAGEGEYEGALEDILSRLFPDEPPLNPDGSEQSIRARLFFIFSDYFRDLLHSGSGVAGQDGRTVRLISHPGRTMPLLYRMEVDDDEHITSVGLAIYTCNRWIDLASLAKPVLEGSLSDLANAKAADDEPAEEADMQKLTELLELLEQYASPEKLEIMLPMVKGVIRKYLDPQRLLDLLFFNIERGAVCEVPATGLDAVTALNVEDYPLLKELFSGTLVEQGADGPAIDYGTSALYTEAELKEASALVLAEFATFEGCELQALTYAGDVCNSTGNILWANSLDEGKDYVQVAEFLSDFHSPVEGGGTWEPDTDYTDYQWWLARAEGGSWELVSYGY